jgi:hypothetical protein
MEEVSYSKTLAGRLHGITSQKSAILILSAVRISSFTATALNYSEGTRFESQYDQFNVFWYLYFLSHHFGVRFCKYFFTVIRKYYIIYAVEKASLGVGARRKYYLVMLKWILGVWVLRIITESNWLQTGFLNPSCDAIIWANWIHIHTRDRDLCISNVMTIFRSVVCKHITVTPLPCSDN